jgi:hypothetical protein
VSPRNQAARGNDAPHQRSTGSHLRLALLPNCAGLKWALMPRQPRLGPLWSLTFVARIAATLIVLLPLLARAQGLPYSDIMPLQEAVEALAKIKGVGCELTAKHSNEDDKRGFKVFLESPKGRTEIKISDDGTFHLPTLPKEDWDHSQVAHTLEKGALTLTLSFGFAGEVPDDSSLLVMCNGLVEGFRKIEGLRARLERVVPEFADLQVAIVGVSFPRVNPVAGKVLLKRGETTVATIDLSQTGEASWLFDQYDPKVHKIVWEMKNEAKAPRAEMVVRYGQEATSVKNAVFLWNASK